MKKLNNLLLTSIFGILSLVTISVSVASAQYYDPNYYNNNYGYNNYNYGNDNGYYNNNYNYGYVPSVSVSSPCYYGNCYNNGYYNNNYNYNYSSLLPTTYVATNAYGNYATLNGYVSVSGTNNYYNSSYSNTYGTAWFQYGTDVNNLSLSSSPANIYSSTNINASLSNLACGTTYYFRAVTSSQNGTQYGTILSFYTANCYNNYYNNYTPYYNNNYIPRNIPTNCTYKRWRRY